MTLIYRTFELAEQRAAEEDGITELTTYIDKETWLQVGSVLKGEENKLVASYYFRDIKLNPDYKADQFTKAAVGE